jgi:predicted esterase
MAQFGSELDGAFLMGHSQTGNLPLEVALLDPDAASGLILIEPGTCLTQQLTDEDISVLADVPILVVFGDNLDAHEGDRP